MSDTSATTPPSPARRAGIFKRLRSVFLGDEAARLEEREQGAPLISYLLFIVQSSAVVLVFAHAELPLLFTGTLGVRLIAATAIFVLVATVIAADATVVKTVRRMPILARNRASILLAEHLAYVLLVLGVEGTTIGVVFATLDQHPDLLLSSAPLIPTTGVLFLAQVALRAAIIVATVVQVLIVSQKLPASWQTVLSPAKEMVGGYAAELLGKLNLASDSIADVVSAYASMTKPPAPRRTWYNGWLVRRYEEAEKAEDARQTVIVEQLRELTRNRSQEAAAQIEQLREKYERELAQARAETERTIERERDTFMRNLDAERRRFVASFFALVTSGVIPEDMIADYPELAGISLDLSRQYGAASPSSRSRKAGVESKKDQARNLLASLDVDAVEAPVTERGKKRGVWITSTGIAALMNVTKSAEWLRKLAADLGGNAKQGTAYIAPLDAVLRELSERNMLGEAAAEYWRLHGTKSGAITSDSGELPVVNPAANAGNNVIAFAPTKTGETSQQTPANDDDFATRDARERRA